MQNIKKHKVYEIFKDYSVIISILILFVIFHCINDNFLRPRNILTVLTSACPLIVMSLGLMTTVLVRGIDLSTAQIADAVAVVSCMSLVKGFSSAEAIAIGLLFGLCMGLINAFLMAYLGVPSLIGTMGMMFIIRSFELVLTNGAQPQIIFALPKTQTGTYLFIGQGKIGGVSFMIIIAIVVIILMYLIRERSVLGRHMDSLASNTRAAYLSGVNTRFVFGITYVFCGFLAALAGIMLSSRSGSAVPKDLETYLNDIVIAVFVSTLISKKGRFNVIGTVIGAMFVCFIANFITLEAMGNDVRFIFNGIVIIAAVSLTAFKERSGKAKLTEQKTASTNPS